MKRAIVVIVILCAAFACDRVRAGNHIVRITAPSGSGPVGASFYADGVWTGWFATPPDPANPAYDLEPNANATIGPGNTIVTRISGGYLVEFVGDYENRLVEVEIYPSDSTVTATVVQTGAPLTVEELSLVEDRAGNAILADLRVEAKAHTFLLQSIALTLELAAGGFLWRTIVVAARLK